MPAGDPRLYSWAVQSAIAPVNVVAAEGSWFTDGSGTRWLDMSSQLIFANVGHRHPRVVEAMRRQLDELPVIGAGFANRPAQRLAELMAEVTPGELTRTFFTSGGAEANEYAIRMARMFTGRHKIVSRFQSYHGSTLGAISATGENRRAGAEPGASGFVHTLDPYRYRCRLCAGRDACTLACADAIEETIVGEGPETVAAVLVEPVTGFSGLVVPPDGYLRRVREACDRHGVLLIFDEVITGFCRTGRWFASEHWGVVPDLMTVAKGINSGYVPLGAVVVGERVAAGLEDRYLNMGLTYAGHPLACAAGVACIDVYLEEHLDARAADRGRLLGRRLDQIAGRHRCVGEVRGLGMLWGLELVRDRDTREPLSPQRTEAPVTAPVAALRRTLAEHRVSTLTRWNLVIVAPPLNISDADLELGLEAVDAALTAAEAAAG